MSQVFKRLTVLVIVFVSVGIFIPHSFASNNLVKKSGSPIRDCVSERGRLATLFLIDQSGSLQETDPNDRRVEAMKAAVAALSLNTELKTINEKDYILDVRFDGFGDKYLSSEKWHRLSLTSNFEAERAIESFASRDDESQTDYKTGLEQAVKALDTYEREAGAKTCKLLVWLSDGELYLGDENSDDAELDAEGAMCEPENGVADQMRSQEIYAIGFGLSTLTGLQPNFGLMEHLVAGGDNCGLREGYGQFVRVQGADALIQALFRDLSPIPPNAQAAAACKDDPSNTECAEFRFFTRPPIDRVKIIVSTTIGISSAEIIEPSGSPTAIVANGIAINAQSSAITARPLYQFTSIVSIDMRSSPALHGEWVVQFHGPEARNAFVSTSFFSDVLATIEGPDPILLDRDGPKPILVRISELGKVGLELPTGLTSVEDFDSTPSLEATLTIGSNVVNTDVITANENEGLFKVQVTTSDLANVGPLGVLRIRPKASLNGIEIAFGDAYRDVKVLLGDGMPIVGEVSASDINDDEPSKIVIQLIGPDEGVGRVSLSDEFEILDSPYEKSIDDYSLRINESQLTLNASQPGIIKAEFDPSFTANGNLKFRLNITLEGRNQKITTIPLDLEVKMTRPYNLLPPVRALAIMIFIFVLTQAAAIAVAAIFLARVRAMPIWTRIASFPITISNDGVINSNGESVASRLNSYRSLDSKLSSSHSHEIAGLRYTVSRGAAIKSLFTPNPVPVTVEVIDTPSARLIGDSGHLNTGDTSMAIVRPELFGSWVLQLLDSSEGITNGHVTVILPRDLVEPSAFTPELEGALRGLGLSDLETASSMFVTNPVSGAALVDDPAGGAKSKPISDPVSTSLEIDPFS